MDSIKFDPPEGFSLAGAEPGRRPEEDVAHRKALRLTFSFRGTRVQLILMEAIDMIVPPSLDLTDQPAGGDFWFELQDGKGTPVYRRVQRHPLRPSVEVRTDDPERPLAHLDSGRTAGEFTLLVPSLPRAQAIVLFEWALPKDAKDTTDAVERGIPPSPSEIARFPVGRAIDKETIARDRIPPTTVSDALAAYEGSATIHLRASDNTGQVASTLHRLDDGDEQQGLTVTVRDLGEHTLRFWSVDAAGNVERENVVSFTVARPAKRGKS